MSATPTEPKPVTEPGTQFANTAQTREEWEKRVEAVRRRNTEIETVYLTHMSKAAGCFYLAGEMVKKGEHGNARGQHALAKLHTDAALRILPGL